MNEEFFLVFFCCFVNFLFQVVDIGFEQLGILVKGLRVQSNALVFHVDQYRYQRTFNLVTDLGDTALLDVGTDGVGDLQQY